jgi:hypothetical protein
MTSTVAGAALASNPGARPIISTGSVIARLDSIAAMLTYQYFYPHQNTIRQVQVHQVSKSS